MAGTRVGVVLRPQATTVETLRSAWVEADAMGADSIWVWDHFFPICYEGFNGVWLEDDGITDAAHFEGWTLLSAMAADTKRAMLGVLVTCNSYRNPELLADMARTVDHIAEGRLYLGIGAGWFERDYNEYGYDFETANSRLRQLEAAIPRIQARLKKLNPPPVGRLPLLIGGSGEKVTLRLVARHADAWNTYGTPENYERLSGVLNEWCGKVDRDPSEIERTVYIDADDVDDFGRYLDAGADHVIVGLNSPFGLEPLSSLISLRDSLG